MSSSADVRARLEASRRELLDLGMRNPLLNYRPSRSRAIVVVDERPEPVFARLVNESKSFTFAPADESLSDESLGQPPEAGDAKSGKLAPRHLDGKLQTSVNSVQLQTNLLNIYRAARSFIEEQGANVLYLALGALEWFEVGNEGEQRRAPLILVPVEISRASAQSRFQIRYSQVELSENLSLAERLKQDRGIDLPVLPHATEDIRVDAYFDAVADAVVEQGWTVDRTAICLGFFAFGKFLIYRDLDAKSWEASPPPEAHPVLSELLGGGFKPKVNDEGPAEATSEPLCVVDMDGTQAEAIAAVARGEHVIIQGPPGTGKSQTITNLIADAMGRGKTVLFVAEKLAALDVVKRRLDRAGLGDACLELHSHTASKRGLLEELQRTLNLGRPELLRTNADDLMLLDEVRERLDTACVALNEPVRQTGVSPYQALGYLVNAARSGENAPAPAVPNLADWTEADWKRRYGLVEELEAIMRRMGTPGEQHPFTGVGLREWRPTIANQVREALQRARNSTRRLAEASAALAPALWAAIAEPGRSEVSLNTPSPADFMPLDTADARRLVCALRRLSEPLVLTEVPLDAAEWVTRHDELKRLVAAGARLSEIRLSVEHRVTDEAWEVNLLDTKLNLAAHGTKLLRMLNPDYRRARTNLGKVCRNTPPRALEDRIALLDALLEGGRQRALLRELQGLAKQLFAHHWRGLDSDWEKLRAAVDSLYELNVDLNAKRLDKSVLNAKSAKPEGRPIPVGLEDAEIALAAYEQAWQALTEVIVFNASLTDLPFARQLERLDQWERELERLGEMVTYNQLVARLEDEGLGPVVALGEVSQGDITASFRRARYEAVLETSLAERHALKFFSGAAREIDVTRFRELDVALLLYNRATLALKHWNALPHPRADGGGGAELALLKREMEKRARWLPIRQLLSRAGNTILRIKPVFLMSPLSIATYFSDAFPAFDLVVFDEASQVKPVDAFGAIARARQVVVVGDKRQMPPTSFFETQLSNDNIQDSEESLTRDIESILGLMEAQGASQHMLRWHYRSRHESLIELSNRAFYDGRLVIFPSPDAARASSGLHLHYLPDAIYDRGGSRTNAAEAQAVVAAVMAHARNTPDLSLGVASLSLAQRQAIEEELERVRRQDASCESFFQAHPQEPFFIKNLETVQGDERDVIIVSTAFGPDANGTVSRNFGPLNAVGGERRLNVLMTRARLRCEVYTSLRPEHLPDTPDTPAGVAILREFLRYAAAGEIHERAEQRIDDHSVEEAIARDLEALGYVVDRRVGTAHLTIDLAVRDPDRPGSYLLAIVCDGPAYASAKCARDRDRLRVNVLESLGWRLYTVWALDWFNRPAGERQRLTDALAAARAESKASVERIVPASPQAVSEQTEASPSRGAELSSGMTRVEVARPAAYVSARYAFAEPVIEVNSRGLAAVPTNVLARVVAQVVEVESPVHISEVLRRIASVGGSKRPGAKLLSALQTAVEYAVKAEHVLQAGEFLWHPGMEVSPVRDRGQIPSAQRKFNLIAPEERMRAVEQAIANAGGLSQPEAVLAAAKLLGYSRPQSEVREGLQADLEACVTAGRLGWHGDILVTVD